MGNWNSVYRRYRSWRKKGVWDEVLAHLATESGDEWYSIDGTWFALTKMLPEEPGAQKKNAGGKSRGGKTTKVHARVDALGHLLVFGRSPLQHGGRPPWVAPAPIK